jgi:exodeoxyribonuclease V gamma subunit
MLFSRIAKTKGHDIVSAWLSHLILNIAQPKDIACETILVTEDATYHFLPVNNPLSWLDELVNLYWQGIHHPLPFFSQSSYAYAKTALGKSKSSPDKKMQEAWESNENNRGEDQDPHHYQVYGESSPLTEEAKSMALRIYEPILAHLAEDAL